MRVRPKLGLNKLKRARAKTTKRTCIGSQERPCSNRIEYVVPSDPLAPFPSEYCSECEEGIRQRKKEADEARKAGRPLAGSRQCKRTALPSERENRFRPYVEQDHRLSYNRGHSPLQ